jgi:outer membrane lipoprotein-sorting protein
MKFKLITLFLFAAAYAFLISLPASAQTLTAREIAEKNYLAGKISASISEATFRLISANGQERIRKTSGTSKLKSGSLDNRSLVTFLTPADVKGTMILTIENSEPGKNDDIWIYLPALKKIRRLISSNKKDSFVGTDFSYGDVIGYKVDEWKHTIVREELFAGNECYVLESLPANDQIKDDSGYSKRLSWIRKDNFTALKAELFDLNGSPLKTIRLSNHQQVDAANHKWAAFTLEAENIQTMHKTIIEFSHYEVSQKIRDDVFTPRFLESAR